MHVPVAYMTDPGQCPAVSRVTTTSSDWREKNKYKFRSTQKH